MPERSKKRESAPVPAKLDEMIATLKTANGEYRLLIERFGPGDCARLQEPGCLLRTGWDNQVVRVRQLNPVDVMPASSDRSASGLRLVLPEFPPG